MKYEGLLMYALQKGTRQKNHLKKVFQNIVIFNLFHYLTVLCKLLYCGQD